MIARCVALVAASVIAASAQNATRGRGAEVAGSFYVSSGLQKAVWEEGIVPYEFHADLDATMRQRFVKAAKAWNDNTCLNIRPRQTGDKAWIVVNPHANACRCFMGRQYNGLKRSFEPTHMWLSHGCHHPQVMHEIGHALGLGHEQSRPDRDRHVQLYTGIATNTQSTDQHDHTAMIGPYDTESIMHYGASAFTVGGLRVVHPSFPLKERTRPSDGDIKAVQFMYSGCKKDPPITITANVPFQLGGKISTVEIGDDYDGEEPLVYISAAGGTQNRNLWSSLYKWKIKARDGKFEIKSSLSSANSVAGIWYDGNKRPPAGTHTITVYVKQANKYFWGSYETETVTIRVGNGPVCHGVRGDAKCGNGKCVGGNTPWPCKCDAGWAGGSCAEDVRCSGTGGDMHVGHPNHRYRLTFYRMDRFKQADWMQEQAWWGAATVPRRTKAGRGLRLVALQGMTGWGGANGPWIGRSIALTKRDVFPDGLEVTRPRTISVSCSPTGMKVGDQTCGLSAHAEDNSAVFDFYLQVTSITTQTTKYAVYVNGMEVPDSTYTVFTPSGEFEVAALGIQYEVVLEDSGRWGDYLSLSTTTARVGGASAEFTGPIPTRYGPLARYGWDGDFIPFDKVYVKHSGDAQSSSFFYGLHVSCGPALPAYAPVRITDANTPGAEEDIPVDQHREAVDVEVKETDTSVDRPVEGVGDLSTQIASTVSSNDVMSDGLGKSGRRDDGTGTLWSGLDLYERRQMRVVNVRGAQKTLTSTIDTDDDGKGDDSDDDDGTSRDKGGPQGPPPDTMVASWYLEGQYGALTVNEDGTWEYKPRSDDRSVRSYRTRKGSLYEVFQVSSQQVGSRKQVPQRLIVRLWDLDPKV